VDARALPIEDVEVYDLDVALREPFGIATGAQPRAENLLVAVRLGGAAAGVVGWGEAAPFPAVNGETREMARAAIDEVRAKAIGRDARALRPLAALFRERIAGAPSARCALETAVLDATLRFHRMPLWVWAGGAGTLLETDLTITTGTAAHARASAERLAAGGFRTIKLKVGGAPLADDRARIEAVVAGAPGRALLLDGNAALGVDDAVAMVRLARELGAEVALFEQPLARDALAGMRELHARTGCAIAADESAGSPADLVRVVAAGAAQVVNVKITKSGIVDALDMIALARAHGLGLMVGGMVETPLAMSTSASLAAGQGGFSFVDLDTPLFMVDVPLEGGFEQQGPRISVAGIEAGHGVRPRRATP
jgi:L-alanine-DL-glutamate epimerase-like enolase superfamily enzyme